MATIKQRLHRKNTSGSYDVIHLETDTQSILRPDGAVLEDTLVALAKAVSQYDPTAVVEAAKKLSTARNIRTNLASTAAVAFDGSKDITPGVTGTLPIANGGTGNTAGKAVSATKLATARTIRTNLATTGSASFDGSANITPGVTGVLPVANGGTGVDSLSSLKTALANSSGGTTEPPAYPSSIPDRGETFTWAGKTWRVSYKTDNAALVMLEYAEKQIAFDAFGDRSCSEVRYGNDASILPPIPSSDMSGPIQYGIMDEAIMFSVINGIEFADYVIPVGGRKVFIPSVQMIQTYCTTNRIFKTSGNIACEWWTGTTFSAPYNVYESGSGYTTYGRQIGVYIVSSTGVLTKFNRTEYAIQGTFKTPSDLAYFRPFVLIRM